MPREQILPDKHGKLEVEPGRHVYWEYYGKGEREPICLLNGLAMFTGSWNSVLPQVYPEYDVILYDYFGQGQSFDADVPYLIPDQAGHLIKIMDHLGIEKTHAMGVSYGGFVGAELGRLYSHRLHTLTLSGILITKEMNFQLYHEISLQFYTRDDATFELYTHYLYEKIFGETFVRKIYGESMRKMRTSFLERYNYRRHCLVRLTEAQDPFFEHIEAFPKAYDSVIVPVLIMPGVEDRTIPIWVQERMDEKLKDTRWMPIEDCGHLTYLERPEVFWPNLRAFMKSKATDFEAV